MHNFGILSIASQSTLALLALAVVQAEEAGVEIRTAAPVLDSATEATAVADEAPKQPKNELVVIPAPSYNPAFGGMLSVMGMYAYRPNPSQSKPWTFGLGGFAAQNTSWGAFVFNRAVLADDVWRVTTLAGYLDLRYDYYGVGDSPLQENPVEIRQRVAIAGGKVLRQCADSLYLGPVVSLREIRTGLSNAVQTETELSQSIAGAGIAGEYDTRDQDFKPSTGWLVQAQAIGQFGTDVHFGPVETAGPRYNIGFFRMNRYQPLTTSTTLGLRFATQYASASTPFYDLPTLGGRSKDLRGYSGEYRDRMLTAVQSELRQDLPYHFGVVAFVGVGVVEPSYAELAKANFHPSVGFGLRYLVANENRINAALDFAWGDQGGVWYLAAGEAF